MGTFRIGDKVRRISEMDEYPLDGSIVTVGSVSAAGHFINIGETPERDAFRARHFALVTVPYPWAALRLKAIPAPHLTWVTKSGRTCRCWWLRQLTMGESGEGVPLANGTT